MEGCRKIIFLFPLYDSKLNSKPLFSNISDITIEVSNTDDDPVELAFPIDTEFLYVSYGIKNSVQSYGGATLIIDVKEVKPCFVPVYTGANVEATCICILIQERIN